MRPEVLLAVLGAALVGYASLVAARRLVPRRPGLVVLAAACLGWAQVVAVAQLLSLWGALRPGPLLAVHAGVALVAAVVSRRLPRPRLPSRQRLASLYGRLRGGGPEYVTLAAVVAFGALVSLVLAVAVAPNNPDALSYHLSRAAYWAQEGSVFHFHGATARQASFPPNAEILLSWLITLSRGDALVQLVQFTFYCLAMVAVYEGARLLHFGRRPAFVAAMLFGCLPQALLQASSAQNDLATTVAIGIALIFGVVGLRSGSRGPLLVSALGLGLAIGTKVTVLPAMAPLLILLALAARSAAAPRRLLAGYGLVALVAVVALAAPNYVQNLRDFDNPLAPKSFLDEAGGEPGRERSVAPRGSERPQNVFRMAWTSFVETTPLESPLASDSLSRLGQAVFPPGDTSQTPDVPQELQFDYQVDAMVDEDASGYGLLGLLVLLPCWVLAVVRGPGDRRAVALAAASGVVLLGLVFRFSVVNGRILLPFVALAAPLMAVVVQRAWTRIAAVALAGLSVLPTVLTNPSKPVLPQGGRTVFALDRNEQMSRRNEAFLEVARGLERELAPGTPIGVKAGEDFFDYPLFGGEFDRPVHRVAPGDDERTGRVGDNRVRAVLYGDGAPPRGAKVIRLGDSAGLVLVGRR